MNTYIKCLHDVELHLKIYNLADIYVTKNNKEYIPKQYQNILYKICAKLDIDV
jgi:hypothetical protein